MRSQVRDHHSNVKWSSTGEVPPFASSLRTVDDSIAFINYDGFLSRKLRMTGYLIEEPMDALKASCTTLAADSHVNYLAVAFRSEMDHLIAKLIRNSRRVILGAHTHHFL